MWQGVSKNFNILSSTACQQTVKAFKKQIVKEKTFRKFFHVIDLTTNFYYDNVVFAKNWPWLLSNNKMNTSL